MTAIWKKYSNNLIHIKYFKSVILLFSTILVVWSCSKTSDFIPTITFVKSEGSSKSNVCEVTMTLPNGKTKIVDSFNPRIDGFSNGVENILFTNISENKNLSFIYIDATSVPEGFGELKSQYASIKTIYTWGDGDFARVAYYKYYLFKKENNTIIVKEEWADLDGGKGGIKNDGIFNTKSEPLKGIAHRIGEPQVILNEDLSKIETQQQQNSNTNSEPETNEKERIMFFDDSDPQNDEYGGEAYKFTFKGNKVEIIHISYDTVQTELKDGKILVNNYYYEIKENKLRIFDRHDPNSELGTPVYEGPLIASKSTNDGEVANNSSQKVNSENQNTNTNNSNSTKQFNEIQLTLTDATFKKAKIYLGEPDKYEYGFGHLTKGFAIYYNRVSNQNGTPKHLVLFLRMKGNQWGNKAVIEEIYSIEDNQKACFGIHCIKIKNQKIYTNALNLIYDSGYDKL